ncbi:MAG: CDP-alcohol phosphatidyltransferase family protein [Oscillospiraceae bacterium]|nr:CDP-alcohol phosphatidyltransferase family protein [Oscillospiraceae bacterium]
MANIITASRILGSICLLFCPAFSAVFYTVYLFCGITDMVDGTIARKTNSVSETGARLDTVADIVFVAVCFAKILPLMQLPFWLWLWIVAVAVIKTANIVWGSVRSKKLVSVHTLLNKTTGFLLFLFPLTLNAIEPIYSAVILCCLATVSAISELHYTRTGKEIF